MNAKTLIVLMLGGAVVYLLVKQNAHPALPSTATLSTTGGTQTTTNQDAFTAVVSTIGSIFNSLNRPAQTSPQTL